MLSRIKISSLALILLLSACGFTPLYDSAGSTQQHSTTATGFDQVSISSIPDRKGQYLRNALIDRFYKKGRPQDPAYRLDITPISEKRKDLDITKRSDTTRSQLRINTTITLTDSATGQILLNRKLTSTTSYNVLQSHFTTKVSEDNARRNALDDLSRKIELQLSLYFKRI